MKCETLYTIGDDDSPALRPEKALEAVNLVGTHFHDMATDRAQKAVSRIQGNNFTIEDVFCYAQTINEIGMRMIEMCARMRTELTPEQEQEPRNKHYIEGIQSTVEQAVRTANDFVKAFHLQRATDDFKRFQEDYLKKNRMTQ